MLIHDSSQSTFSCSIVIKREGQKITASDVPVADWNIDEDFSQGKATIYRLSALANGVRFTAEMAAKDCDYSGYGWPAQMSDELVLPTFERLLAEGRKLAS